MSAELVPVPVPGTDRQIMATQIDGRPMVSIRHACEVAGLDCSAQLRRLNRTSWATVAMTATVATDANVVAESARGGGAA